MKKDQINVGLAEGMSRSDSLGRRVDHAEVHHFSAGGFQLSSDPSVVTLEPFAQARELTPISVKPDAEEADAMALARFSENGFHLQYRADIAFFDSSPI